MLSDEEKTTLEFIKINNKHKYCGKDDVDFLLNLIEKQSKEIEELKEKKHIVKLTDNQIKMLVDIITDKRWEHKIKAKIEEIENTGIDVAWEQVNYINRERDRAKIEVLQLLLEKE